MFVHELKVFKNVLHTNRSFYKKYILKCFTKQERCIKSVCYKNHCTQKFVSKNVLQTRLVFNKKYFLLKVRYVYIKQYLNKSFAVPLSDW